MPAIGITGGVATGKSAFMSVMLKHLPAVGSFDADRCVHELFASDEALLFELRAAFGESIFRSDFSLDRQALREIVFQSDKDRRRLEALIHPRVHSVWRPIAAEVRGQPEVRFFDIPLLYETGVQGEFDRVLVVACAPEMQRQRLAENRGLASHLIKGIIGAQSDLLAKVARADYVVWNDGSPHALDQQARLFATYLRELYG